MDVEVADRMVDKLEMLAGDYEMSDRLILLRDPHLGAWLRYLSRVAEWILLMRISMGFCNMPMTSGSNRGVLWRIFWLTQQRPRESITGDSLWRQDHKPQSDAT